MYAPSTSFFSGPNEMLAWHLEETMEEKRREGVDQSASWAPKMVNRSSRHLPAPGARAHRHIDHNKSLNYQRQTNRHSGKKHEYKEWGHKHGDLKPDKVAHKDMWSKFLTGEEATIRDVFESEFENKLLQVAPETLAEQLRRRPIGDSEHALTAADRKRSAATCEALIILTYAPTGHFVTVTVKHARNLAFNIQPFARVLMFEGRRLVEHRQTATNSMSSTNQRQPTRNRITTQELTGAYADTNQNATSVDKTADFSEAFVFAVTPQKLGCTHAVVEIFDYPTSTCEVSGDGDIQPWRAISQGHVVLGPNAGGQGTLHWHQMVQRPGYPSCMWHCLQSKAPPRVTAMSHTPTSC